MPIVFRCSRCGHIIRIINRPRDMQFGVPSPSELLEYLGIKHCPKCGKELDPNVDLSRIRVRP